ncbi:MAG: HisA/HisF-related TIM barrel protein [Planctomycetaceae bacterium]
MQILPVIDIQNGVVVRGVAGERDQYRPVESGLTNRHDAIAVAEAIRDRFGLSELYVADLDAIRQGRPHFDVYSELARRGFRLDVDAGLTEAGRATELLEAGVTTIIAGLETILGLELLSGLVAQAGETRVIFSLDLHAGEPLFSTAWAGPKPADPAAIAYAAYDAGVRRMIVLDLKAVGVGEGVSTLRLCRALRARLPNVQLLTGGGVRNTDDLHALQRAGVDGALVASALHNGAITPDAIPDVISSTHRSGTATRATRRC